METRVQTNSRWLVFSLLSSIGTRPPQISDVSWRLKYNTKVGEPRKVRQNKLRQPEESFLRRTSSWTRSTSLSTTFP